MSVGWIMFLFQVSPPNITCNAQLFIVSLVLMAKLISVTRVITKYYLGYKTETPQIWLLRLLAQGRIFRLQQPSGSL